MEDPESAAYDLERTEAVGYLGASSIEGTPVRARPHRCLPVGFKAIPLRTITAWVKAPAAAS